MVFLRGLASGRGKDASAQGFDVSELAVGSVSVAFITKLPTELSREPRSGYNCPMRHPEIRVRTPTWKHKPTLSVLRNGFIVGFRRSPASAPDEVLS
jgi:hypothetical protein